jgi:polyprenyl-phospho-N-acetylgalactosaminyl synthase
METWIVIPAFNEEKGIQKVINELKESGYNNIIVVDDGSKDKTFEKSQETGVIVLKHLINRGQGAALKTGIECALENNTEVIITFDSDGQHQVEDIGNLILPIKERDMEVVLGSRFLNKKSNVPFIRKLFLKCGAGIFRIMYNVKLTDSHNGLRALSRKAAETINISQDKMEHASEIIEEIGKHKLRYCEVPVTIKYSEETLRKGQKTSNAFYIFFKMVINKFSR